MTKGKAKIVGKDPLKRVTITVELSGARGGSVGIGHAGVMPNITNDVTDVLRKHFCAHQITIVGYKSPSDGRVRPDNIKRKAR